MKKIAQLLSLFFILFIILLAASLYLSKDLAPPNPFDPKYDWMDELIEKNFKPFERGITEEMIDRTEYAHGNLARMKVVNNRVIELSGRSGAPQQMLRYLAATYGLPDLDMLYWMQDGIDAPVSGGAPIFVSSKVKGVKQGLYFIDWYTVLPHSDWDDIAIRVNQTLETIPWEKKVPQLIWRGNATDGWYTSETWKNHRRGKLCQLSLDYPELIDARFNQVSVWTTDDTELVRRAVPMGNSLSYEEQVKYKYQMILDGIFTTFPGDRWRLLSNSVVFMHESERGHWYYEALIPWVHYVPIKSDMSDLLEKLEFVRHNEALAKRLASNAREFALNFLMTKQIAVYCYKALLKYASLQKFCPIDSSDLSALPRPYCQLKKLYPFNPQGWYSNAEEMEKLIKKYHVKSVVEVGSWLGLSTRHIAQTLPKGGVVYAVDTWRGTEDELLWNREFNAANLEIAYDQFLSNVIHAKLTDKIVPIRMESAKAAIWLRVKPDLIYLDASARYENVLAYLRDWYPLVRGHGIICGDDFGFRDRGVEKAVTQFAKEHHLTVHTNDWFWYLDKE